MFPPILKDFTILLEPESLKTFNKINLLKHTFKLIGAKTEPLDTKLQRELAKGLRNTDRGRAIFSLRIYFAQLYLSGKISIDLRSSRFFHDKKWMFRGEHFAYSISNEVRNALLSTYDAYYTGNPKDIKKHLLTLGLMDSEWPKEDKEELYKMFISHFQLAGQKKHEFLIDDLVASFKKIFLFIRERGSKVPTEFAILGLYLVSLYMNIEQSGEHLDVKQIFIKTKSIVTETIGQ
jgi:hypothetical protein